MGRRWNCGCVSRDALQVAGQRAEQIDALDGYQLSDLLDRYLGLSSSEQARRKPAFRRMLGLGLHLFCNAQALEHLREVNSACSTEGRIGVADGLGGDKRSLQRLRRRNIRFRRAFAHGYADTRARKAEV